MYYEFIMGPGNCNYSNYISIHKRLNVFNV
jgi:hypothetical protein